jgi:nucleoside-diphosphate-sugar epimerase
MVGSAIVRQLLALGHAPQQLITRTHAELDLTDQAAVRAFLGAERPDQVYLAAAKVGGIGRLEKPPPRPPLVKLRRPEPCSLHR